MSVRPAILKLQDYKCFYCSRDIVPYFPGQVGHLPDNATRDHIIAKNDFKKFLVDKNSGLQNNTVAACYSCNSERACTPFVQFYYKKQLERLN